MDHCDCDVITVPAGQICWQTQHPGQAVLVHGSVPIVTQGVAQQVGGHVLVLQDRLDSAPPLQQEALQAAQGGVSAGDDGPLLLKT